MKHLAKCEASKLTQKLLTWKRNPNYNKLQLITIYNQLENTCLSVVNIDSKVVDALILYSHHKRPKRALDCNHYCMFDI